MIKTFDELWEQIHREQNWGKYPSEEVVRFVARNYYVFPKRGECRILDFGCGAGAISWFLAREGFKTFAFDGSKTAIEKALKRMNEENVKVKFSVTDASETHYESNYFDAVIDSAVIYANKVNDIELILSEIARILKPGGKIFSTGLFNIRTTGYGTGEKIEEGTYREVKIGPLAHRGTVHFFTYDEVMFLWNKAGFRNLKIDTLERTDAGGKYIVSYYLVEAQK